MTDHHPPPPPPPPASPGERPATVRAFPSDAGDGSWEYDIWLTATCEWSGRVHRAEATEILFAVGYSPNGTTKVLGRARDQYDVWRRRQRNRD